MFNKFRNRLHQLKVIATIQAGIGKTLKQSQNSRGGGKWSHSAFISMIEATGYVEWLNVEYEKELKVTPRILVHPINGSYNYYVYISFLTWVL